MRLCGGNTSCFNKVVGLQDKDRIGGINGNCVVS